MSRPHPIIAVTGSSGAGTSTVRVAFERIFRREGINAALVEGDSFHRYGRNAMEKEITRAREEGRNLSHFGPSGNHFDRLQLLFQEYGESGTGTVRRYLHDEVEASRHGEHAGTFTPWKPLAAPSDLLFYEGLHGGVVSGDIDIARCVDLLIGVVPIINLEWIQKLHRDTHQRGYSNDAVVDMIMRRMPDYIRYIVPQFSRTHINFQRVPTVDTSNPFIARDIPSPDESFVVIRFRSPKGVDFPHLLNTIHDSFMSRRNTIVVPGGKMGFAMEVIFAPLVERLMERARVRDS